MQIEKKIFERVLNMAQMYNVGVFQRGPHMLWTCRWHEENKESSIAYEIFKSGADSALGMRLRYAVLADGSGKRNLDYTVSITTSRSYKQKTWYWYVCPLVINNKACHRRVRSLYFLPNSDYFGCEHCRDLIMRSLPERARYLFRQTQYFRAEKEAPDRKDDEKVENLSGWRPTQRRLFCPRCRCLSEGRYCCNCGSPIDASLEETYFEMLGVRAEATVDEMRVAFIARLKEYHPDRVAHLGLKLRKLAEEEIKNINLAYETLSDPVKRDAYIREIEMKRAAR